MPPTTKADRSDYDRLSEEDQIRVAQRAYTLCDGTRTFSKSWKLAMAEYRLSRPRPYVIEPVDRVGRGKGSVACTCGWDAVSNSPRGLTISARAHTRSHSTQRRADQALVSELDVS